MNAGVRSGKHFSVLQTTRVYILALLRDLHVRAIFVSMSDPLLNLALQLRMYVAERVDFFSVGL